MQQEKNQFRTNRDDDEDSHRRNDRRRLVTLEGPSLDLLREMRKEMDKLRSIIEEKTDRSLDRMVKRMHPPFMGRS